MKTSRRLMLATFLTLLATPVVIVAYGRISGAGTLSDLPVPERPSAAELTALRDFDAITARGDFMLEITSAPQYSVSYVPPVGNRGFLRANVADGTLTLEGFGNRSESTAGTVRITLPRLTQLEAQSLYSLSLRNFDSDALRLHATRVQRLILENNRIDALDMTLRATPSVDLSNNTILTLHVSQ